MAQSSDITDRMNFAVEIARDAGEVTRRYFRRDDLVVDRKSDESPVTIADKSAEELLRQRITGRFSRDAIIGEEFGEAAGSSGYQWILDPIDGTKSFIHGVPLYTTLVAVLHDNQPVVGLVYAPALHEMVWAAKGCGCFYQRTANAQATPARVSTVNTLSDSLLLTTEVSSFTTHRKVDAMEAFLALQRKSRLVRTWGDGYGYLLVATGRAEVMIDPVMNVWDAASLQNVIEEAGGHFIDWKGVATVHSGEGIATNGKVTQEVLDILRNR